MTTKPTTNEMLQLLITVTLIGSNESPLPLPVLLLRRQMLFKFAFGGNGRTQCKSIPINLSMCVCVCVFCGTMRTWKIANICKNCKSMRDDSSSRKNASFRSSQRTQRTNGIILHLFALSFVMTQWCFITLLSLTIEPMNTWNGDSLELEELTSELMCGYVAFRSPYYNY